MKKEKERECRREEITEGEKSSREEDKVNGRKREGIR